MLDLHTFLNILKRRWYLIVLVPILAVAIAWVLDSYATPVYRSDIRMLIYADKAFLEGRDLIYGYYSLDQASIVATFVELANSRRVFSETMTALNIQGPVQNMVDVTTVALPNSTILELAARGPDPVLVQQVANSAGNKIVELIQTYYSGYTIEVLDSAYVPRTPVSPNPVRDSAVALVLGVVLGSGLAVLDYFISQLFRKSRLSKTVDVASSAYSRSYLERYLTELSETKNLDGCLAIIRLNGLKGIQGKMSRQMYQRLQQYVVGQMTDELRGKDRVARWNDTSFAIFMPKVTTPEAVKLLESVQLALEQPQRFPDGGPWIYFDPRIGGVTSAADYHPSTMIQEAEAALAKAGLNGAKPVLTTQFSELRESH